MPPIREHDARFVISRTLVGGSFRTRDGNLKSIHRFAILPDIEFSGVNKVFVLADNPCSRGHTSEQKNSGDGSSRNYDFVPRVYMKVESKLSSLGIKLFSNSSLIGNFTYVPVRRTGNLAFVSGQLPRKEVDGKLELLLGKVGATCDTKQAIEAAKLCGVSILSVLKDAIGSLDRVKAVVKVEGFVNAVDTFEDHPLVINGCSDLFVAAFGPDIGSHARAAVGCASLPKGVPVEIAAIFELSD